MNFNNLINKNGFNEFIIKTEDLIINDSLLKDFISLFFNQIILSNKKYFVLITIEYDNKDFRTISKGKIVSSLSLQNYIDYILSNFNFRSEDYKTLLSNNINFKYFELPNNQEKKYIEKWDLIKSSIEPIKLEKFGKFNLASNMNYYSWGNIFIVNKNDSLTIITNNKYIFFIYKDKIDVLENHKIILSFYDKISDNNKYDFVRIIDNYKYYIKNNSIILTTKELKTNYLTKLSSKDININKNKIITFDIETLLINKVHKPYLYSMFDGNKSYSWFTDSPEQLFNNLLRSKYRGFQVFAHNLSRFDIYFIFKHLASLKKQGYSIKILMRDENIISITIENKQKNISITIKDSFLILPSGLSKLTKQFKVEQTKLVEPVFVGEGYDQFKMNDLTHYSKEILKISDFMEWKNKIQKYCEVDCISLHQVILKFRILVYDKFKIDILNYPTIPSLSFAIFRMHYLKENTIPLTKNKVFEFIKESFTGGRTDVYKPYGKNIHVYDVNSLYPKSMETNKYPIGKIIQFDGDPTILSDKYWIGDTEVKTSKDLYIPPLQLHHNILNKSGGLRTLSPNGSFKMKLNSVEYYSYLNEYNFNILNGYLFNMDYIFTDFVNDLFDMRKKIS